MVIMSKDAISRKALEIIDKYKAESERVKDDSKRTDNEAPNLQNV